MGRRPKWTFLQRRYNRQAHDKMLDITNYSVQFSSVAQSYLTLCDPINCSTSGLPVHHQLPEFTHVHRVGDAIQPSHPLSFPPPGDLPNPGIKPMSSAQQAVSLPLSHQGKAHMMFKSQKHMLSERSSHKRMYFVRFHV